MSSELESVRAERDALLSERVQSDPEETENLRRTISSITEEREQLQEILQGLRDERDQLKSDMEENVEMVSACDRCRDDLAPSTSKRFTSFTADD